MTTRDSFDSASRAQEFLARWALGEIAGYQLEDEAVPLIESLVAELLRNQKQLLAASQELEDIGATLDRLGRDEPIRPLAEAIEYRITKRDEKLQKMERAVIRAAEHNAELERRLRDVEMRTAVVR